jgi:hypothetical protein
VAVAKPLRAIEDRWWSEGSLSEDPESEASADGGPAEKGFPDQEAAETGVPCKRHV